MAKSNSIEITIIEIGRIKAQARVNCSKRAKNGVNLIRKAKKFVVNGIGKIKISCQQIGS
jgi:hypothetical protein